MYKYFLFAFMLFGLYSCSSSVKKAKEAKNALSSMAKMAKAAEHASKDYENLSDKTPLTNDQLKDWMPEELIGLERVSYTIGQTGMVGLASLSAKYTDNDHLKTINLSLMDGADSMGAALLISARMMFAANVNQETESTVTKTVTRDGNKAIVEYKKDNSSSSIKLLVDKRFLLTLEGKNVKIDNLWKAVDDLDLDDLD